MKKLLSEELLLGIFVVFISGVILCVGSLKSNKSTKHSSQQHSKKGIMASKLNIEDLRAMYSHTDSSKWEVAHIDESVVEDFAFTLGLLESTKSLSGLDSKMREEIKAQVLAHLEIKPLPLIPPYPSENPFSEDKRALGEKLFNDPRLSLSNQIACASCHDKELGFADNKSVSYGHNRAQGKRNSPSVVMGAFGTHKFWDGRASSLESQSLFPIADPKEMAFSADKAARKLNKIKEYKDEFKKAFGTKTITKELLAQAIATYERSLMPPQNRFDRFLLGNAKVLNDEEVLGLHLFRTKARCMNCHNGVAFSDDRFHNLGLHYYGREKYEDLGRYEVTKNPSDVGKFKTPSLRWVSKTAPYMHNGLFPHLRGTINAYNAGMANPSPNEEIAYNPPFPASDELLQKLDLTQEEIVALEAFLKAL